MTMRVNAAVRDSFDGLFLSTLKILATETVWAALNVGSDGTSAGISFPDPTYSTFSPTEAVPRGTSAGIPRIISGR